MNTLILEWRQLTCFDREDSALYVKKRDIESTTTEVVDENVALLLRLSGTKTVGDGGSGRLVDDTENVEAGNGTSVLGSLSLVVVEVGWDCDNGLLDLLAELGLSDLLHLQKDHGRDLLWGESLGLSEVLDLDERAATLVDNLEWPRLGILLHDWVVVAATDQTLDIEDCVLWVHSGLVLGGLTDKALLAGERDERWGGEVTLLVGDWKLHVRRVFDV